MKKRNKTLSIAMTAVISAGIALSSAHASSNPFTAEKLDSGYSTIAMSKKPQAEAKCGEGKCGSKKKEAKCGEGKSGSKKKEGKCGAKKKEAKCGEAKCGASH